MNDIDRYILKFPVGTQMILEQVRTTIRKAAPEAVETIRYSMPTFILNGKNLVHFAAFKNHIGLYPVPAGNEVFAKDFPAFKTSGKGTIQFPLEKPIPLDLIDKIVKFRIQEILKKTKQRKVLKITRMK